MIDTSVIDGLESLATDLDSAVFMLAEIVEEYKDKIFPKEEIQEMPVGLEDLVMKLDKASIAIDNFLATYEG